MVPCVVDITEMPSTGTVRLYYGVGKGALCSLMDKPSLAMKRKNLDEGNKEIASICYCCCLLQAAHLKKAR